MDKVRIADHRTLSELTVESAWPSVEPDMDNPELCRALAWAETNEGPTLERLAEEWLLAVGGSDWIRRGLEAEAGDDRVEIDVAAAAKRCRKSCG